MPLMSFEMSVTRSSSTVQSSCVSPNLDEFLDRLSINTNIQRPCQTQTDKQTKANTKKYTTRTIARLQYSPPNDETKHSRLTSGTWRERAVSPDLLIVQQQAKLIHCSLVHIFYSICCL
eukprot:1026688_1